MMIMNLEAYKSVLQDKQEVVELQMLEHASSEIKPATQVDFLETVLETLTQQLRVVMDLIMIVTLKQTKMEALYVMIIYFAMV